jgi:serine/threonine protein kinase/Tfp pilus assembly protein PilF
MVELDEAAVFNAARKIDLPDQREAYLRQACGNDRETHDRVITLLAAYDAQRDFLESPPVEIGPPSDSASITEGPGTVIGHYKLLELIGEGGFAVVYMAEQTEPLRRQVALKIIKLGMDTRQVIARFEAERQALAMMDHPGIARVHDAGATETGRPYFVMQLIRGVPITEYCDENILTTEDRLRLFMDVCHAVQHAHQKGIIHRDIKPTNVLVALHDGRPVPKVIDFGIAKATHQRLTEKTLYTSYRQIIGTPQYMSPEQAEFSDLDIDTRSDIYSLGVLLYELLTSTTPFQFDDLQQMGYDEICHTIRHTDPPTPSRRLSTLRDTAAAAAKNRQMDPASLHKLLRGDLDWIVMKALENERTRRYATASQLAEDIRHFLDDEPLEAGPPAPGYRFRKFARRNKTAIAAIAAVALALIAGIIGTTWQAVRATQERNRALAAEGNAKSEAERADAEAGIALAVNDFLKNDLLGMADVGKQVDAKVAPDPNIKLRTLLDRAAASVEARFKDRPLVESAIRNTIGSAYQSIGEYSRAETQLQRALELRKKAAGTEALDTLRSMYNLSCVYWLQGRYDEAEALVRKTIEIQKRTVGEEHLDTLRSLNGLAGIYLSQGRYDDAEPIYRLSLEILRRRHGEEHPGMLKSISHLAALYFYQGRFDEAEKLVRPNIEIRRRTQGDEHPDTLDDISNLAAIYVRQGRYDAAEKLFHETLEMQTRALGEDHSDTLSTLNNLAEVYRLQDNLDEAEALHRRALEITSRTLGDEHPHTLLSTSNLAAVYFMQGRNDRAEELFRQTLEICRRTLGDEHPRTLDSMNRLARVYVELRRFDEADAIYGKTLEIRRRTIGEEHPDTLLSMANLAHLRKKQERFGEAEALLRQALDIHRRTLGDEHPDTLSIMGNLVSIYRSVGRYDEAESLRQQALEILHRLDSKQ